MASLPTASPEPDNPYVVQESVYSPQLATLVQRALGGALDNALLFLPLLLVELSSRPAEIGTAHPDLLRVVLASLVIQVAVNFYLLITRGQTLGKLAVQTRIVLPDGQRAGFYRLVWRRGLINGLFSIALPAYVLVDHAFIFRPNRRCVHDYLAGTIVVQA